MDDKTDFSQNPVLGVDDQTGTPPLQKKLIKLVFQRYRLRHISLHVL